MNYVVKFYREYGVSYYYAYEEADADTIPRLRWWPVYAQTHATRMHFATAHLLALTLPNARVVKLVPRATVKV